MEAFLINNRPANFLIIEDFAYIIDSYAGIIHQEGGAVIGTASTIEDATNKVTRLGDEIDIITLDINLGRSNTLPLLISIKKLLPKVPVIIISGSPTENNVKEGLMLGASLFVAKPCSYESFVKAAWSVIQSIEDGTAHKPRKAIKIATCETSGLVSEYISQLNIRTLFNFVLQEQSSTDFSAHLQKLSENVDIVLFEYDDNETQSIEELFLFASNQKWINQIMLASRNQRYSIKSSVLSECREFVRMASPDTFASDFISQVFDYTKMQSRLH